MHKERKQYYTFQYSLFQCKIAKLAKGTRHIMSGNRSVNKLITQVDAKWRILLHHQVVVPVLCYLGPIWVHLNAQLHTSLSLSLFLTYFNKQPGPSNSCFLLISIMIALNCLCSYNYCSSLQLCCGIHQFQTGRLCIIIHLPLTSGMMQLSLVCYLMQARCRVRL